MVKSDKMKLNWPSYKVTFNQKFSVIVYSAPSNIQVEIVKSSFINKTIDTISLSIPGINSKTVTSAEQRFANANFAFNGQQFRKGEQPEPPAGSIIYKI